MPLTFVTRLDAFERGLVKRGSTWDPELRWLASRGVEAVPVARKALLQEGGHGPATDLMRLTDVPSERRPLPPSPFDAG
jgi:hypothetical protein